MSSLKIFDNLICKNTSYSKFLIEATCVDKKNVLFNKFVEKFFAYLPVDYISDNKIEVFTSIAKDTFDFFKTRDLKNKKIDISSHDNNGKPFISIKLINTDKPFIVDSIKCLFKRINTNTKFLFHPVISVTRDSNGNLIGLDEANSTKESLVSIVIYTNEVDDKFVSHLKNEITNILDKVESTYSSWPNFLKKVDDLIELTYQNNQIQDLLHWIKTDNFTFLGYVEFDTKGQQQNYIGEKELCDIASLVFNLDKTNDEITLGQINKISPVHKNSFIDYIKIIENNKTHIFIGLYSAAIYYTSVKNIPILREKLNKLLVRSNFAESGYNYKKLREIIECLPRQYVFTTDDDQLYCITMHILSAMATNNLKLFIQPDNSGKFVNTLIFMPRHRLNPDVHSNINKYLSEKFKTNILSDYITEIEQDFCYLYLTLEIKDPNSFAIDVSKVEEDIDNISSYWPEKIRKILISKYGEHEAAKLVSYVDLFPKSYQYEFDTNTAVNDISYIQGLNKSDTLFNLEIISEKSYNLKIYTNTKQSLSNLMPLIENLGFKAIDEQVFEIHKESKTIWIYDFHLEAEHTSKDAPSYVKQNVEDALNKMHQGLLPLDSLCKLVVLAGFNWRNLMVIKGLTRYLHQTNFPYAQNYVQLALISHYEYTDALLELFESKFNPEKLSEKISKEKTLYIKEYLGNVKSSTEDKVLRSMLELTEAILRTNCYQLHNNEFKNYISFKFDSSKVPGLPLPIPYAEIFVYSNDFEGIHLRGGRVARGGIRWSDRGEDYRTEVLGLMKAQMTKNSVIVPVGSKGGFFVKFSPDGLSREDYMNKVIESYKNLLRGMLDITDNIIDGKIITPKDLIIYDNQDPYLVVAADKGTATFSDYANSISKDYDFWLGDAFASGGSAGYDHKKMAITSKGAWISVTNHFATLGKDVQKDTITVLGIGDMSGDVFGNGMLLSHTIKLVAAFNHMHIFIDPNPDPETSFTERKRLFEMPGSKWSDYNTKLMSKGGAIFARSSKLLNLTPEIQNLLSTSETEIEPDNLINLLLKTKVDLLWNGGIGTYIKASDESHLEIGDKANDNLRCNGKEVGAKVIGEGGNLGVSQRGRIEFSKNGGRINTDFIDNSGGVDCSDHEVNIKIAMQQAMKTNKINLESRNSLLKEMTNEVASLVLEDNFKQTQAITITEKSNAFSFEMFSRFITDLEKEGLLDRAVEFLPNDAEISRRIASGEKMTRPELSVLLSYGKMMVYNDLFNSKLADDKFFEEDLINYFPKSMQNKFKEEILSHPLRKEIILTIVTNKMVNQLSGPIIKSIQNETGAMLCDITRSYMIINSIFNLDDLWTEVENSSSKFSSDIQIEMFTDLGKVLRRGISWFVRNLDHPIDIKQAIEYYKNSAQKISTLIGDLLIGDAKTKLESKINHYINNNVSHSLAQKISILDSLISVFDIILISSNTKATNEEISKIYFEVSDRFNIDWLRKSCEKQLDDSYWNRLSIQALKDDLYDKQRRLLQKIIEYKNSNINIDIWIEKHHNYVNDFMSFVEDLKKQENINMNMMILANKKFEMFLRKV